MVSVTHRGSHRFATRRLTSPSTVTSQQG